jgi:tetrahydromethanopterin S-methyltransferase subunit G
MRIIALKLKKETRILLRDVAKMQAKRDTGFVEDLYSLMRLRGIGIPTKDRIKKMTEFAANKIKIPAMVLSFQANKRAMLFSEIVKMPYFRALCKASNTIQAVERFLSYFTKLHNKIRQAQCLTCPLMQKCDFGQQYGNAFIDITMVVDPDFSRKVHPDCPELPEIDTTNQIATATAQMNALLALSGTPQGQLAQVPSAAEKVKDKTEEVEEKEGEPVAEDAEDDLDEEDFDREDDYIPTQVHQTQGGSLGNDVGTFYGGIVSITEKMIDQFNTTNLSLFELGRKLDLAIQSGKKNKFKPTPKLDRKSKDRNMKAVSDITKINPQQHGLPEEVFNAKADKKQLQVKQNLEKQTERQLLYLLVDNSISMGGQFPGAAHLMCSRGTMASLLGIALCRHVLKEDGIVFLRFFATSVTKMYQAEKEEEFKIIETALSGASYTGSGTRILIGLSTAMKDIEEGKRKGLNIAKSEVLLITDCEDMSLNVPSIQQTVQGVEFNVLDVAGKGFDSPVFKATAKKYYKADETELDINKIVSVI